MSANWWEVAQFIALTAILAWHIFKSMPVGKTIIITPWMPIVGPFVRVLIGAAYIYWFTLLMAIKAAMEAVN